MHWLAFLVSRCGKETMKREHQIIYSTLQAQWWIASATTGHCLSRQLFHGTGQDRPYTDSEKVADALETAQRHMAMIEAVSDDMQANARNQGQLLRKGTNE